LNWPDTCREYLLDVIFPARSCVRALPQLQNTEKRGGDREPHAGFVHKLRIAVKELNETGIRLLITLEARIAPAVFVENQIK
jgi:hypothetical protein